jgi:hypothetical protein
LQSAAPQTWHDRLLIPSIANEGHWMTSIDDLERAALLGQLGPEHVHASKVGRPTDISAV